jgi:uncharacterized protein (TIGR01244 family)
MMSFLGGFMKAPTGFFSLMSAFVAAGAVLAATAAGAQTVTHENIPGISNFARLETTVACAGVTSASAVPDIKKLGYKAIINLRESNEAGADVEGEEAAAKAVGLNFVHVPFNIANPDPKMVDNFIAAVTKPENNPAFIHCAAGGRAASLWMIKRVQVDGWDQQKALDEAVALGLNDRLKPFALNYLATHKK